MSVRRLHGLARALRDQRGSTAAEFALVLFPLILLTIGSINVGVMIYTVTTLHFAAEDAARCATVKTTVCTDPAATATYAASRYKGAVSGVTFVQTTAPCGNVVTGTVTYRFSTGLTATPVPLSASACYPLG
ncbi:MAG TPA: TadE/TadG family type IV pilus assembly protein [Phenylobacterium sp.]|nr:TadE/TadG family type IV pilus assembly protein [Phenylobacterium sp.]